jgi:tight adherence protein B
MSPEILAAIMFVVVTAFVAAIAMLLRGNGETKSTRRLDELVGKKTGKASSADMLLDRALREADRQTLLDRLTPEFLNLEKICEQADVSWKPSMLFGISIALALVGGLLSALVARTPYVAPVGALLMFSIPWIVLFQKRNSRLKKFAEQLPDALELVARALRAGHSLAAGMHVVAEEMPPPIAKEFGKVYDAQNLGIPLEEAMRSMCDRVPNLDLRFFVTAVAIQRQTGGDLAEILDKIGYVIRERYKILGMVKALTAEGRLSGVVLIALPFVLFLLMLHMKYDYIALLWQEKLGQIMGVFALIMQVIGAYAIKKIVDIQV